MDSSVAFGSEDWDEFMLERGDGGGESAPVYLFEMESRHSKEQSPLSGAEPGCSEGEVNQERAQLSDIKGKDAVYSAEHPRSGSSGGNSGFNAEEGNQLALAKENESNGNISCENIKKKEEGMKVSEGLGSLNGKFEGKELENRPSITTTGGKNTESEIELKGIDQVFVIFTRMDNLI